VTDPHPAASATPSSEDAARVARRYAAGPARGRKIWLGAVALVFVALVVWTVWAFWVHVHPKVNSAVSTWHVEGQNAVKVVVDVKIYDTADAPLVRCTALAYADDHSTVGEASFRPIQGQQTITIRTVRQATSVDWLGCTAPGQNDAE